MGISKEEFRHVIEFSNELQWKLDGTRRARVSAWNNGVVKYALMILDNIDDRQFDAMFLAYRNRDIKGAEKVALNGAKDWREYSEGGCALVYHIDILETLCNATELKRLTKTIDNGKPVNTLAIQERALFQAWNRVICRALTSVYVQKIVFNK